MQKPKVSIIIPTFNAEKFVDNLMMVLIKSINSENFNSDIYVIDAESIDLTLPKLLSYKAKVLHNFEKNPVKGRSMAISDNYDDFFYLLDQDELPDVNDLETKLSIINELRCDCVISNGYSIDNLNFSQIYSTIYGDPFSAFYYNFPNSSLHRAKLWQKYFDLEKESKDYLLLGNEKKKVFLEMSSQGTLVRRKGLNSNYVVKNGLDLVQLYHKIKNQSGSIAVSKNSNIMHVTDVNFKKLINKIKWRVQNNLNNNYFSHEASFSMREFSSSYKYLFILYNITVIPVLIHSILLTIKFKKWQMIFHCYLSLYTLLYIIFYSLKIRLGFFSKKEKRYGF